GNRHARLYKEDPLADLAVSNVLVEASIAEEQTDDKVVKAWIVAGTNLPLTMPDKEQLIRAFDSLEFVVVVDTMPMEITGYADVILPECTYLERYDELRDSPHREPWVALRMPATEPRWETRPAWWIAKQLGDRMGLKAWFNYSDYTEVLDWQLRQLGSSLEEMQQKGMMKLERASGTLYLEEGQDFAFNTPSGKIEFYSHMFEAAGFDPMPVFTAHPQPPDGYYRLIYGRAPMHTFSRTANNPNLTDLMEENNVWVNPKTARVWGLRNGQEVYLKNQDEVVSSFPVKVRVTERIRWDSVYIVHGFGHSNKWLSRAFGKGLNDSELITNVMVDPIMGGTGMRGNFVTFVTEDLGKEAEA
ncbi:MAG TPA: molybdopterin-dependent oxidoreductase, partial [Bacteroidales bacterium]|nr:molybdopterin-dependent oxidoreductase [Bacteroidales bacterium]